MELQTAIEKRRSTRSFTDRKLTKGEISELLRAATMAPSACNMQSWYFYIITDEKEREKLKNVCADWISTAPVVFIVCTDANGIEARFGERGRKFPMQDTALAMENMLLKAADMGLGGCIIGAYKQNEVTELFSIPKEHTVVALLPIGEPTEEIPARERKDITEVSGYIGSEPEDGVVTESAVENKPYELKHAYLANAVFDDLGLPNASFNNIYLEGAKFNDINLSGAKYTDINLSGSSYAGLNMTGAEFRCVELNNAVFGQGCECHADGSYCVEMKDAVLDGVDLSSAQFNHCGMEKTVLTDISMAGAKLYDIDLDGGDLSGVNMVNARIQCSNLFGTAIKNCCFENAALENCDINGMTIDGVNVAEAIATYKAAKGE